MMSPTFHKLFCQFTNNVCYYYVYYLLFFCNFGMKPRDFPPQKPNKKREETVEKPHETDTNTENRLSTTRQQAQYLRRKQTAELQLFLTGKEGN